MYDEYPLAVDNFRRPVTDPGMLALVDGFTADPTNRYVSGHRRVSGELDRLRRSTGEELACIRW
ncbi:hypothetical protein SAM23877_4977 [Streptomyces ambofaciens ATCC 23877]|uniref:Uncharacterized protein n=1 Tax=Streptomyces ambofaciens (strain ATCC 23877 / 3486 / DSM 40053 / JCM 4204 / NBRC 12836 / NRRL B-2516) TaxID=278992 RepID=A0A0K2AYX9_STRA7|nr:hypothetical protein SAM23877_4977 [Streptomyces ambofaciens ATCC 23877]